MKIFFKSPNRPFIIMIPTQLDLIVFTIFTPSWALVSQQTPPNYLSFTNTNPPTKLLENRINGSKIILILNVYVILMMTSVAQSHIFALSVSPTQLFYPKTRHWHQFNHRFLKAIFKTSRWRIQVKCKTNCHRRHFVGLTLWIHANELMS